MLNKTSTRRKTHQVAHTSFILTVSFTEVNATPSHFLGNASMSHAISLIVWLLPRQGWDLDSGMTSATLGF